MKILAVGDLHTKTWIIDEVERVIDSYDAVIFVGDYADNWNTGPGHTMAVWRCLKIFADAYPDKVGVVLGNHDYSYLYPAIAGQSSGFNNITYTLINSPENKKIKSWLLSLPIVIELDGVTFSHAGVTENWNGLQDIQSLWNDASPIWARPREFGGQSVYKNIKQVFGHNASKEIWQPAENAWCIDTFSEDQNNNFIGDQTVLEIIDGEQFNILKLKEIKNEHNNNTTSFADTVS